MFELDSVNDPDYGGCPDCTCCSAAGCIDGEASQCPTDRLGDSVCPCTSPI